MNAVHGVVEIQSLTRAYHMSKQTLTVLKGIDLKIVQGEFVAIMGPSGSGKSTLLAILGCLDRPTSGKYWLEGQDVGALGDKALAKIRNQRIGFVFQNFQLLSRMDLIGNVTLPLLYAGYSRGKKICDKAQGLLQRVGLGHRLHHRPTELSGGEQQRVAIARALVADPAIVLADEPTGNLDSSTGREILDLLQSFHSEGRTLVMVTHSEEVAVHAQRIVRLSDGEVQSS